MNKIFQPAVKQLIALRGSRGVHTPRRALLYVPGDDKRKLRKANSLAADCIALDLEDAVALNKKVKFNSVSLKESD